jgi:hypothetical protein
MGGQMDGRDSEDRRADGESTLREKDLIKPLLRGIIFSRVLKACTESLEMNIYSRTFCVAGLRLHLILLPAQDMYLF